MTVSFCGTHENASIWFNKNIEGIGTSLFAQGVLLFAFVTQLVCFLIFFNVDNIYSSFVTKVVCTDSFEDYRLYIVYIMCILPSSM